AVVVDLDPVIPRIQHGLDGDHHSRLQEYSLIRIAEVWHLGIFVHPSADPVTDEVADHRITLTLGKGLDGMGDVSDAVTGHCLGDSPVKGFAGYLQQA